MPTFLHVGSGTKNKQQTTPGFNRPEWNEIRQDIDPRVKPDVLGSMTDLSNVPDASVDAIFSSHNIEHLHKHEVPLALREFFRVLKPDGFVIATCPDMERICAMVGQDKIDEPMYIARSGEPITPLDAIYGWQARIAEGNEFMAHKMGFTARSLRATFRACGFANAMTLRSSWNLWVAATKTETPEDKMREICKTYFGT